MSVMMQKQEEIKQIVEQCLDERMTQFVPSPQSGQNANLGAELRHQRELMQQGFAMMDKRFEAVDKRFEAVDKRFEAVDKRFEAVDKRFEELRCDMNQRFELLITLIDKRFEAVDKRFAFMQWLIVAGFGMLSLMLTFYKFFAI